MKTRVAAQLCTGAGLALLLLAASCGFGHYDDLATPLEIGANDGVHGHGQWWPWACANASYPSPPTPPLSYTATGTCGGGGAFTLSVDGCDMQGSWAALGLTDVSTTLSSSIPEAGGWQVVGTDSANAQLTCDAVVSPTEDIVVTCSAGTPAAEVCKSTLTPES